MPEHTTAHNNTSAAAAAAPIITTTTTTTITSSKKTSVEDERDIDAPKVSYKAATVTALATAAGKEKKKTEGEAGGKGSEVKTGREDKGVDVKVNEKEAATKSAEGGGDEDATRAETGITDSSRINEANESAELPSDRVNSEISNGDGSTSVEGASKSAEIDKTDPTSANKVSKSAEEVNPGNATAAKADVTSETADSTSSGTCVDPDRASESPKTNKSARTTDTTPLDVDEPSKSAEPAKPAPTSDEGSRAGSSKLTTSAPHEPDADEQVGEHGLSPRDAVHSNNVRNADEVIKSWGPVLLVRNLYPGMGPSSFIMEKSVFDHPLRQVLSALDYYEELRKRATLTQNQQRLVAVAEHTRDELRRLQRVRDSSVGPDVADL